MGWTGWSMPAPIWSRCTPGSTRRCSRALLDEARTFNLRVAGHLGLTDAVTAARLGLGSLEHLSGIPEAASADPSALYTAHRRSFFAGWTAFERSWAGLDSVSLSRVAGILAARNVIAVPTLVLHETFSRLDDPAVLGDTMLNTVPEEEQSRWNVPDMIARAGWTEGDFAAFRRSRAGAGPLSPDLQREGRPDRGGHRRGESDADPGIHRSPRDGSCWSPPA